MAEPLSVIGDFPYEPSPEPLRDFLEIEFDRADVVLTYSPAQSKSLAQFGVAAEKIATIPLPVELRASPLMREPAAGVALYVGRLDAGRGIDLAVAACEASPQVSELWVAGPIVDRRVAAWISRSRKVKYLGVLNSQELATVFSTAHCLLCPSIESFGLAVVEAVASGLPVICSRTTGVSAYLPPESVSVVPERSLDAWEAAVTAAMDRLQPSTATSWLGDLQRLLGYEVVVEQYVALFRSLLPVLGTSRR
jgi:glycosyltransferase involved in cell wall biosynthesis